MRKIMLVAGAATLLGATAAQATTVTDNTGDLLPSFVGTAVADLDITSFTVTLDQANATFDLTGSLAGPLDPTQGSIYVIGVNTGTGANRPFGDIGEGNIAFNQAIVFRSGLCDAGLDNCTAALGAHSLAVTVSSDKSTFSLAVPVSLLPSTGFAARDDQFNLWSRNALVRNSDNADFAPDNAMITGAPEPAAWALMICGFGLLGARLRRRSLAAALV